MVAAAKKAEPVLVTGWYGHDQVPVHVGAYEVRNNPEVAAPNIMTFGNSGDVFVRWWDGDKWLMNVGGGVSIMDLHPSHQWRGRRMWVLAIENCLGTRYLTHARPKSQKFGSLNFARPFKTERAAQRFAARYSHLGLTAVLP